MQCRKQLEFLFQYHGSHTGPITSRGGAAIISCQWRLSLDADARIGAMLTVWFCRLVSPLLAGCDVDRFMFVRPSLVDTCRRRISAASGRQRRVQFTTLLIAGQQHNGSKPYPTYERCSARLRKVIDQRGRSIGAMLCSHSCRAGPLM